MAKVMVHIRKCHQSTVAQADFPRSDRCAESDPHTMQEDRIIIESVLAQNRDAILDLHNLTNTLSDDKGKQIERTPSKRVRHHQELSKSTGVEILGIPDVLPPSKNQDKDKDKEVMQSVLDRTFSKRGARLGVHASILDLDAHEAPTDLKKKWIQQAHLRKQLSHTQFNKTGLTALPELSRISEVDTNASSCVNLHHNQVEPTIPFIPGSPEPPKQTLEAPMNTPAAVSIDDESSLSFTRKAPNETMSSKLRRVFSRISLNSTHLSSRRDSVRLESAGVASSPITRNEQKIDSLEKSPNRHATVRRRSDQENKPRRRTFSEVLKDKFAKGPLAADQFDEEYRHSRL